MPTRTELVISIGDVICCLPPGKAFKRKRYNSFDANVGNEENLAPGHMDPSKTSDMRQTEKLGPCAEPDVLTVRAKRVPANTCDGDEEVSFRKDVLEEESHKNASDKTKRKTTSERFLEDNANYFQLEVLAAKTRSKKLIDESENQVASENEQGGFHHSFLDFLKSKDVDQKPGGRARHKSDESEVSGVRDKPENRGRSRSSSSHYGRSVSSGRSLSSRARSRSGGRKARIGRKLLNNGSDLSPGTTSDASSLHGGRQTAKGETSASESEVEARPRRSKAVLNMRELSLSGSEAESVSSTPAPRRVGRRGKTAVSEPSSELESDDEKDDKNDNSPRKGRRSELDKLLEAVDTSFHFETAAAERKRLCDSNMKPLEIDCSDTGSEASCNVGNKRKFSEEDKSEETTGKKCKGSNNLLKTASPSSGLKMEATSEDESDREGSSAWEGWESLNSHLESITHSPVAVDQLHFSFEKEPKREGWYSTYQRQDRGDEVVFYPASTSAPFFLPYEMNYASFLPVKGGKDSGKKGDTDVSRPESKASSPARQIMQTVSKKSRRKISECESTDSEDPRQRRGKGGRFATGFTDKPPPDKLGAKTNLLLEPNCRQSPRCHASTKSIQHGALPGELDDLAEAYLMQDERDLHFPHLASYLHLEENSNDSHSSGSSKSRSRTETTTELCQLATNIDRIMMQGAVLPVTDTEQPTKVPPTRSRVSSEELLSPKKPKKRKKHPSTDDSISPLDQLVADDVDPVLLDCLEDELPTVPLNLSAADTLELVSTYSTCTSMSTCNSRWLRPSKRSLVDTNMSSNSSSAGEDLKTDASTSASQKKVPSPSKPKRIIIYKEDLPGFSIDSDMETEKLPVSKRVLAKAKADIKSEVKTSDIKSPKELKKDKEETSRVNSDEDDSVSVESFGSISPSSKKKRKANRTGFPSPKKKKKIESPRPTSPKSVENQNKSPPSKSKLASKEDSESKNKTKQESEDKSVKKKVSKQVKMDLFITKKSVKRTSTSSSPLNSTAGSRRSAALKAKNYSEMSESDTESLFEVGGANSTSPSPAPSLQKPGKVGRKK